MGISPELSTLKMISFLSNLLLLLKYRATLVEKTGVFKYAKNVPYYSKSVPNCSKSVSKLYINDRFRTFETLLAHLRTESGTSIIVLGSNFSTRNTFSSKRNIFGIHPHTFGNGSHTF